MFKGQKKINVKVNSHFHSLISRVFINSFLKIEIQILVSKSGKKNTTNSFIYQLSSVTVNDRGLRDTDGQKYHRGLLNDLTKMSVSYH